MKAKEDRPNSQDWSVCLEQGFQIVLGATQKKSWPKQVFVSIVTVLFKIKTLLLIQRSFSTRMAKLNVFSCLNISYLSLGQ